LQLKLARFPLALMAFALIQPGGCFGGTINLGVVELVPGSGDTVGFNILNLTGSDSSSFPDTSFPVTTSVPFSDLTLYINFANGTAEEFLPSSDYFSSSGVGQQEFDLATDPIGSAIVTGTFGETALTLNDGSRARIDSDFGAIMVNPVGNLRSDDFATVVGSTVLTPEPGLDAMLAAGLGALILLRRRRFRKTARAQ
jgi:hypothetical protein